MIRARVGALPTSHEGKYASNEKQNVFFSSYWQGYFQLLQCIFCVEMLACVCTGRCVCPLFTHTGSLALLLHRIHAPRLCKPSLHTQVPQLSSNRTSVVRCGRQKYERLYPVMLVRPDGSTVNIRYKEPKHILVVSA